MFHIFQNSPRSEGKREKGMGGSRRGEQQQKAQSKELKQAEGEHREPEITKSVEEREFTQIFCFASAQLRSLVRVPGTDSQAPSTNV